MQKRTKRRGNRTRVVGERQQGGKRRQRATAGRPGARPADDVDAELVRGKAAGKSHDTAGVVTTEQGSRLQRGGGSTHPAGPRSEAIASGAVDRRELTPESWPLGPNSARIGQLLAGQVTRPVKTFAEAATRKGIRMVSTRRSASRDEGESSKLRAPRTMVTTGPQQRITWASDRVEGSEPPMSTRSSERRHPVPREGPQVVNPDCSDFM